MTIKDDILFQALLLHSIQCNEFVEIKLEIKKNLDMNSNDIIKSLKAHQLALDSEEQFKDGQHDISPPMQAH